MESGAKCTPPSGERSEQRRKPEAELLPNPWFAISWLAIFAVLHSLGVLLYMIGYSACLGAGEEGVDSAEIQRQVEAHMGTPRGLAGVSIVGWTLLLPALLVASNFRGQSWRQTLAIRGFGFRSLWRWLPALAIYLAVETWMANLLDIKVSEFMEALAGSRHLLLALVMVLWAPMMEELLFRGYLFQAWRHSSLGLAGTLVLTSVLFALAHWQQYGWEELVFLFVFSVMMGLAREKSDSVLLPMLLHALSNLMVTVLVVYMGVL